MELKFMTWNASTKMHHLFSPSTSHATTSEAKWSVTLLSTSRLLNVLRMLNETCWGFIDKSSKLSRGYGRIQCTYGVCTTLTESRKTQGSKMRGKESTRNRSILRMTSPIKVPFLASLKVIWWKVRRLCLLKNLSRTVTFSSPLTYLKKHASKF